TGSRYGAAVSLYYTLAWFDRYLRHRADALERLTARRFDGSADVHNISGGTWDGTNHPAHIAGQPVANRLSFHFRSAYSFAHGRGTTDLVAPTPHGHRTRHTGPGRRLRRIRGAHRIARGLFAGHRGGVGRVLYGIRRRRVRFLAVVPRSQLRRAAHRLRAAGL